jgi:hypothetical protein
MTYSIFKRPVKKLSEFLSELTPSLVWTGKAYPNPLHFKKIFENKKAA